jgi:hypothetical protein
MKIEMGKVRAMFTRIRPTSELLRFKSTNKRKIGMIFTWPGIAKPSENSKNKILPVKVISREIEYAARLANNRVIATEKTETITLFINGFVMLLSTNNLRKLSKLHTAGRDNGFV